MALADRDPNTSGRTSRASNMSAGSRGLAQKGPPGGRNDLLSSAPGVASMLRTSTELGNLGGFAFDSFSNMPNVPRASRTSSRMSTASSHSNHSRRERDSRRASGQHHAWPSTSSGPRNSMTRSTGQPQYVPDTLSPTVMNLPHSSPLVPHSRNSRDGGRSRSMTHASHPHFMLSSNRSYSSLRTDLVQRPRSPYEGYPQHFRRPGGMRSVSPAISDYTDPGPRRPQGNPSWQRMRVPSDMSVRRDHRGPMMPPPLRTRSPAYYANPHQHSDVPPVPQIPPYHQHRPVPQARTLHKQARGSASSSSINQRTDSDAPSSDGPSPPTPRDGASMGALVSPTGTQVLLDSGMSAVRLSQTGPLYYDGSEEFFEREDYVVMEPDSIPTGFGNGIKTIMEERVSIEMHHKRHASKPSKGSSKLPTSGIDGRVELPASPVPRRITRDLILSVLEAPTPSGNVDIPVPSPEGQYASDPSTDSRSNKEEPKGEPEGESQGESRRNSKKDSTRYSTREPKRDSVREPKGDTNKDSKKNSKREPKGDSNRDSKRNTKKEPKEEPREEPKEPRQVLAIGNHQPTQSRDSRHSIVSDEVQNSLMDSSTVELAMRFSSPGAGTITGSPGNVTTEDGMSDLLDGYQHTETKEESELIEKESPAERAAYNKKCHTPKSSNAQSFKSCTDVVEVEQPGKDSDGRSFKTCKDEVTPSRAVSMPVSRLPSLIQGSSESRLHRPVSEVPSSSPRTVLRKKAPFPIRDHNFPKAASRIQANSKLNSRHGSTVTSISSSVDGTIHQSPPVPPRDSSSSKEAQRTTAVATYLLRGFRSGGRFASFGKKSNKNDASVNPDSSDDVSQSGSLLENQGNSPKTPVYGPLEVLKRSGAASTHEHLVHSKETPDGISSKASGSSNLNTPTDVPDIKLVPSAHRRPMSTPSAPLAEPSSVYSADNISSSSKSRTQSSPAGIPKSPDHSRSDSQTTTHLVWPGRRSLHIRSTNTAEPSPRQSTEQEDTTTDLRLSSYRQPMQMHYLPDLKEESHEDSSLNTSASNLKNSSFRFPHGGQPSIRASVDETILFGRNASFKSVRNSGLAQTQGLPSMNFSRVDLVGNLNELFDTRSTRSFDAGGEDREERTREGRTRSISAGGMHDKYKSVFAGLEGMEKAADPAQAAMDLMSFRRRYTARDIMSDIENLDVPSVNGLTLRISELFPGLREGSLLDENGAFLREEIEHVLEELQEVVGPGPKPAPKRSSARLRPVPGSPNMVVVEDAVYEELTGREKEGDSDGDADTKTAGDVNRRSRPKTPLAELEAPCASKLRPRSLSLGDRPSSRLSLRRSQLSLPSTPTASTDTHPWHNDKSFPWAATIPSIDISLPDPTTLKGSPRPGPSPLRSLLSGSSGTSSLPTRSAPVHAETDHVTDDTGEARNLCCLRSSPRDGKPTPPELVANGHPNNVRGVDQSHEAGDRYPTSSLSPPSHAHLSTLTPQPPTRLSDSDEEILSPRKRKLPLLPRLASAARGTGTSPPEDLVAKSIVDSTVSPQILLGENHTRPKNHRRLTFVNATGMSPHQFRMNRLSNAVKDKWHRIRDKVHWWADELRGLHVPDMGIAEFEESIAPGSPEREARARDAHLPLALQEANAGMRAWQRELRAMDPPRKPEPRFSMEKAKRNVGNVKRKLSLGK